MTQSDVAETVLRPRRDFTRLWLPGLVVVLLIVVVLSLAHGRFGVPLGQILTIIGSKLGLAHSRAPETARTVILDVRLPRVLAAMLIGGALSLAGSAYQGLFRNPLVSPDILGASAGAGFGAALGILLSRTILVTQLLALGMGLAAVSLVYLIASRIPRGDPILVLVLTGMLVGTVFASLISATKFLADPYNKLPAITFWLMGSLASVDTSSLLLLLGPVILGAIALFAVRWQLNALAFGEDEARALGAETGKLRIIVIGAATLMTAASVSICGMVGWVGLVIPHLARSVVGPDYRRLIPVSAVLGAVFLIAVDDLARAWSIEIPLGILTALIGAPWFLLFMARASKGWK